MIRIKHIIKQVILDNNSSNVRFKFVKTTRNKIIDTREKKSIRNIKFLLNDLDRKSRCYKSESKIKIVVCYHIVVIFILITSNNCDFARNTSLSKNVWFFRVKTLYAQIDERNSARFSKWYSFSKDRNKCFAKSNKVNVNWMIWKYVFFISTTFIMIIIAIKYSILLSFTSSE